MYNLVSGGCCIVLLCVVNIEEIFSYLQKVLVSKGAPLESIFVADCVI